MSGSDESDTTNRLSHRQQVMFDNTVERFEEYLLTAGKTPRKDIGYATDTARARKSRVLRIFYWIWEHGDVSTELSTEQADRVIEALDTDELRRRNGDRYSETSKRKMSNALADWFAFKQADWEPDISFRDERATDNADPFTKSEVKKLWQTSLTYKNIPKYNNLSPKDRDRWRRYLAQYLGKPKEEVEPADWREVNRSWKVPSLVRSARAAGWRPAIVGRMRVHWYDPEKQAITIPGEHAVKNESRWKQELPGEAVEAIDRWLDQRENKSKYDDTDLMWLTRKGQPYSSSTLNALLRNLMDEAGIEPRGRNLVWYSFRHYVGTYVYDDCQDLKMVAKILRQNSIASADRYVHPTVELQRNIVDGL
ncbi:hypothetical protein GCM10009037_01100 [Halarchaeum grantii]|uniref:Site-specific recombinase XerD n=1 Tax=Halarchaeum grantii TaxID=1193105 RepID=A0A830EY45_9EURY|nr:site-specific integrase [Halarchaeum grantii]GGL21579.1 hypothetical protein GCM10009037_01100 [Halarchaeum grantii]